MAASYLRRRLSWLSVIVVVAPMLALAAGVGHEELVFPEAAALTFGVLGLDLPGWRGSPLRLALLPPVSAAIGLSLTYATLPRWTGEVIALAATLVMLQVLNSRLTPSLSAAMFPLVFDVHSWLFLAAVSVICIVLACAAQAMNVRHPLSVDLPGRLPLRLAVAAWVTGGAWIVIAGPVWGLPAAALAPPLIVAMTERLASADRSATTGLRHGAVIVIAAAVGVAAAHLPTPLGGIVAVAVTLIVFCVLSQPHPPALAICLIPQVTTTSEWTTFVGSVGLGTVVLYATATALHRSGYFDVSAGQT